MKTNLNKRQFISILLLLILVLTNSGCANTNGTPGEPTPGTSGEASEAVTITFGAYEYQRLYYEALMETFNEANPNITVQFVDLSQVFNNDGEWSVYSYLRQTAQAADVVLTQGYFDLDMSRYFRELRPLYEADTTFQPEDYWPGILNACEDSYGNMVGLPMVTTVNGIFYDKAAFDAAGMPYPEPGWTWEDFQKTITALADKNGSQIKYGFYDQPYLFGSILSPIISDYLQSHGGEVVADELLNAVKWYIDLAKADILSSIKPEDELQNEWEERVKLFDNVEMRPAMWIDSLVSSLPSTNAVYDPDNPFSGMSINKFNFTTIPVSTNDSFIQSGLGGIECASVSAGSPNPRAAWAWLNFLSKQWLVTDKTQPYEISRAPARRSVAESSGFWDLLPDHIEPAVRYTLEHGSYGFSYFDQFNVINIALSKTITENADFEQALQAAAAELPATPTPPADNEPIVVATPLPALPEGVSEVKYFFNVFGPNELEAVKVLADQFNQRSTDSRIRIITDFHGNPTEDWITSMASNFDCFTTNQPYWQGFDTSSTLNINTLINNEPTSFSGDFYEEMLDRFRKDGNQYGLPAVSQVQMIAYNADLLERRGLQIPDNDWTFDDFIEMATTAASTAEADPSYGLMYSPYEEYLLQGEGIKWADFDSNPPKVYLDSPEMQQHLEWLVKMEQENVIFNAENNWEKMQEIMTSGQLAFWTAMMGEKTMWFYQQDKPSFKIGMAPFPRGAGGTQLINWSNDRGHYISAQTENVQTCWEWIKFMSEQPTLFLGVPARRSMAESPAWEANYGKEEAEAYKAAVKSITRVEIENIQMQQLLWPLSQLRYQATKAVMEGEELQPLLSEQQQKAETFMACALTLDASQPMEQLNTEILDCIRAADPEGNW